MAFRLPPWARLGIIVRDAPDFTRYVIARYRKDRASGMAASLAYTSLLSLVPLMAIALAMLAAFPVFSPLRVQIESWIFTNFVPAVGHVVQDEVSQFIANAGRLSAAGIVGLGVTAIMLLVTIETAFNQIFRVDRHRSPLSRLLVYWTMMTLGPLVVGASLSIEGHISALALWQSGPDVHTHLASILPTLLSICIFTIMYSAIPNRTVPTRDALIGGMVSGVLFAVLRWGFALYIVHSDAYASVYGAVAAVPIVLFWMFLSWVVVLIGAETTAALAEWRSGYSIHTKAALGERRLALALEVLWVLQQAARLGHRGTGRRHLLQATVAGEPEVMGVIRRLSTAGFLAFANKGTILLARDLSCVCLKDLVQALDLGLGLDDRVAPDAPWRARILPLLAQAHTGMDPALAVPLSELFQDQD